jgi:hypothetical protein
MSLNQKINTPLGLVLVRVYALPDVGKYGFDAIGWRAERDCEFHVSGHEVFLT